MCLDYLSVMRTVNNIFHIVRESEDRLVMLRETLGTEDEEALIVSQEKYVLARHAHQFVMPRTPGTWARCQLTHPVCVCVCAESIASTTLPSGCFRI
jgi:hypothetical protein